MQRPEARVRLRRKLETWPDDRKSPISINAGLALLNMVERQEKMIDWLAATLAGNLKIQGKKDGLSDPAESYAEYWREAARKAVSEK